MNISNIGAARATEARSASAIAAAVAAILVAAAPAQAAGPIPGAPIPGRYADDAGAAARIEAADRLRTLSHEVASAACHLHGGVAPEQSRALLVEAKADFVRIQAALREGDAEWGIPDAEHDRRILADLDSLAETWVPVQSDLLALMGDASAVDALARVKAASEELHAKSHHLQQTVTGRYANPVELLASDAILLDVAGRQAALTQKIAKEACEVWTGNRSEDRLSALSASADLFEAGIRALHDGMPELGIRAAPSPGIRFALAEVMTDWEIVRADLELIAAGEVEDAVKADLYARLNAKMYALEDLVHAYVEFSKREATAVGN